MKDYFLFTKNMYQKLYNSSSIFNNGRNHIPGKVYGSAGFLCQSLRYLSFSPMPPHLLGALGLGRSCHTALFTVTQREFFFKKCLTMECALPVLMPSVIIHAPVVSAALAKPWLKISLSLEGIWKFWMPPWTEITSFGNSIFHSFSIKCNRWSNFVS